MESLTIEIDLPTTRDRLWELLTTAEGLTAWLAVRAVVEPHVGGRFEVAFGDLAAPGSAAQALAGGRVLSIDHPRLLVLGLADGSEVEIELKPRPDGVGMRLSHAGIGEASSEEHAWFSEAWQSALERLQVLVLREGVPCDTVP